MKILRPFLLLVLLAGIPFAAQATEGWQSLFDGKSLSGWQANENPDTWRVEDGALVSRGKRSHLFYTGPVAGAKFKNFEFSAEVLTEGSSNSGIYIHTKWQDEGWPAAGYECQVINASPIVPAGKYTERKLTGSIYAVRNTWRAPVPSERWFEYRIIVRGKTIQTYVNGELVCQYTEGTQHWRADSKPGRWLSRGTFALQGHDPESVVHFRNLRVRVLPDTERSLTQPMADLELDELIGFFSDKNFALIDFGIDPANPALRAAQRHSARRLGYNLGYEWAPGSFDLNNLPDNVMLFTDADMPPKAADLKKAKKDGKLIAFSSGGDTWLSPYRIKARLKAMKAAGLGWADLWVPGGGGILKVE